MRLRRNAPPAPERDADEGYGEPPLHALRGEQPRLELMEGITRTGGRPAGEEQLLGREPALRIAPLPLAQRATRDEDDPDRLSARAQDKPASAAQHRHLL